MTDWTPTQRSAIADAYELEISSRRRDGSLSPKVTIWAVGVAQDIYIRSVNGPEATWFHSTRTRPTSATQRVIAPLARQTTLRLTPIHPA